VVCLIFSWVTRQPVMVPQDITVLRNAEGPLDRNELVTIDAWWRAANYLAVGQIHLSANPLLREPLQPQPSSLGRWDFRHGARSEFSVSE